MDFSPRLMSSFALNIMNQKYAHEISPGVKETWEQICERVINAVFGAVDISEEIKTRLLQKMIERKFIPGGRYLYACGRSFHQVQNCLLLSVEDSREGWADLLHKATMALMTGAGIGVVYSALREEGALINRTGGKATGPLALMGMINEAGRGIMQGGSRRCLPGDALVTMADWTKKTIKEIKVGDLVQTRFGERMVVGVAKQGVQEIIEVETEHGSVKCSPEHRWLASDTARNKCWKKAKTLSLSNKLYFHPAPTPGGTELNLDYAYMLGYFLGDGCAYSSNRTHEITFQFADPKRNQKQVERIAGIMRTMGTNPIRRQGHGNCTELRCRSKKLVSHFQKWKTPHLPFDIPDEILKASLEARYAFVAGWFDADGYFGESAWKIANKHPSTRKKLMEFLRNLGFLSTENGIEVRFSSYQAPLFARTIGKYTFKKWKQRPSKQTSEIPSKILAIRTLSAEETYDIQIAELEEFIAYDFVSHNSAIWAGIHWNHPDILKFIEIKNWSEEVKAIKAKDYNFPATLDGTNISVILDDAFFEAYSNTQNPAHEWATQVYWKTVENMLRTGEPGFSIDVGVNSGEHLRNACTELTSRDDSDICNIGSINLSRVESLEEMKELVELSTIFLLAGTIYSDLPYEKVRTVREKNRRLGLGLMGLHDWLIARGKKYGPDAELEKYLKLYAKSTEIAHEWADRWGISRPLKTRAIAPTGSIGILAETTTGIEPIFCVSLKRNYLVGSEVHYEYIIDPTAKRLIESGVNPEEIEDAYTLAKTPSRRLEFQAWVQQYVDHGISSTLNLPEWGSPDNNPDTVKIFGETLMQFLPKLRGVTTYPDGARSGQPLTRVPYAFAINQVGKVFVEQTDLCDLTKGGSCGS